jgi:hypothetical protein
MSSTPSAEQFSGLQKSAHAASIASFVGSCNSSATVETVASSLMPVFPTTLLASSSMKPAAYALSRTSCRARARSSRIDVRIS